MSLCAFRKGHRVRIGVSEFLILQRLPDRNWQLQNTATGEWCTYAEHYLLDRFANNELSFIPRIVGGGIANKLVDKLTRDLSSYPPELVTLAKARLEYLKEIDRRQPIAITQRTIEPLVRSVSGQVGDSKAPGWRTVCRDYRKWLAAGRDIRAVIFRYGDRGKRGARLPSEAKTISDQVIDELYMAAERKRVPEVHSEILRRLTDANKFRPAPDRLPIPSLRTIYREISRRSPYEVMAARYGKRRAEMEFRASTRGPETSRALQRMQMDHTPADIVVVDDATMLPLGRPTITTALDEYTRCPTGFYAGFEPPSCLAVMRCLKHAILPKTYVSREFPSIKNSWECYGIPELLVVDNPPEFHSTHFERACLQIGADIQYAKVLVPWYKGKLERFQGTMNRDLLHGEPGTTFSSILERDEYDPTKHAVVLLSTFREILHKWIIDVYLRTPHRGIKDIPAHCWNSETNGLPPPLPPSAAALDIVLGMTTQRVAFHYGIELEGLTYNNPELGELRRRMGTSVRVDLTFDPGDLGHINVLDPCKGTYICVPALDQAYASRLSLWQHKVIRRYAQQQLSDRTDIVALAQAKADIRALVERDFHRKSTCGRKRRARFLTDHTTAAAPEAMPIPPSIEVPPNHGNNTAARDQQLRPQPTFAASPNAARSGFFNDDDILPVFEANLDLPQPSAMAAASERNTSVMEEE